jgi:hypothetical protein
MKMYRVTAVLIFLAVLASACSSATEPPQTAAQPDSDAASSPTRSATVTEAENDVQVKLNESADFTAAQTGMTMQAGGSVQTGEAGKARLDLLPEGTIIRVAPNSTFVFTALEENGGKPQSTLELLKGKIWVLLKGGDLSVKTPSGVASVRGSLLGVSYDPEKGRLEATCLEGDCALKDDDSEAEVELTDGEYSYIEGDDSPSEPEQMTEEQLQEWVDENPEFLEFFEGEIPEWLPEAEASPEPEATDAPEATGEPGTDGGDTGGGDGGGGDGSAP